MKLADLFEVPKLDGVQAMAFQPLHQRDARMTRKAEFDGCEAGHHRRVGGRVLNPDKGPYRPDPSWMPCDYSVGSQIPEDCGGD
jgi:hypothetical protein